MANSWLIYFVLIGFCIAQYSIDYSEQVYQNAPSSSYIAIAPVGSPSSCSGNFFLLTNNTSSNDCFQIANNNHTIISRSCPTELRGSTSLSCVPQLCFVLNPSLHQVVILNNNGTTLTTFGSSQLSQPTIFTSTQRNNSFAEVIVVDGLNILMFTVSLSTFQVTSRQVVIAPQQVIGISMSSNTSIILAYSNSTSLTTYTISTNTFGTLGPQFGNIGSIISQDTYNRIYVYDSSCNCIKILTATGVLQSIINSLSSPIFISQRRNSIFVINRTGIFKFIDTFRASFSTKPRTCLTSTLSISASFFGGDYPLNLTLLPDYVFVRNLYLSPGNYTTNITLNAFEYAQAPTLTIFDDAFMRLANPAGTPAAAPNRTIVPATRFPPHSGNASYGFIINSGQFFSVAFGSSAFNPLNGSVYEFLTFWINVGEGGQYFKIELTTVGGVVHTFNPGDLPRNTWVLINYSIPEDNNVRRGNIASYNAIQITDLSRAVNQNMIYIDDMQLSLIDVTSPNRKLYVFDACGITSNYDIPLQDNVFRASINSTGVSCNVISTISTNLTTNAIVNSYLENGNPPFSYKWAISSLNSSNINNMPAKNSYITVYDNVVNSSISWFSTAASSSFADSTRYHSPPYSISCTFSDNFQAISFTFPQEYLFGDYSAAEFWINTGDVGQQLISVQFQRGGKLVSDQTTLSNLAGVYTFPRNTWIKIRYEPNVAPNIKFNGLLFNSEPFFTVMTALDNFYIDDIVLIGKDVLVVTDSTGCSASTRSFSIPSPPPLLQNIVIQHVKCFGSNDGSAIVQMTGGTPPYSYAWSNPSVANTPQITNLNASEIYVNVADSNECEYFKKDLTILQPPPMVINVITQPIKCNRGKGIASASTVGGSAPYTYIWSSASTTTAIPQPSPQPIFTEAFSSQFLTLNGEVKCMGSRKELQSSHSGYCSLFLPFSTSILNVSIVGCSNCMQLSKNSKLMFWIFVKTTEAINQLQLQFLKAGEVVSPSIPLSSLVNSLSLEQWNEVSLNLSLSNDSMPDELVFTSSNPENMGTIILDDIVLIPVDIFSTGDSVYPGFNSFVEVVASQYFISVVDANGCSSVKYNFTMAQPEAMSIYFEITVPTSINGTDGSLFAKVAGGTPPYTYLWNTNETTQGIQGPIGGYKLQVTDSNGCIFEDTYFITDSSNGIRSLRSFNSPLAGGLAAIIGAGLLVVLFAFVMLSMFWNSTGFSALGTFFSSTLLVGVLVGLAAASVLLPKPTDQLCLAFPWLLGIAFILVYGCLFIKTWTLYRVWRRASNYQRTALTPAYIIIRIGIALLLEIVLLAVWTAVDPPRVTATNTVDNTMEYQCDTEHPTFWIIFLSTKGVWLLFGAVMSILTRNIAKEFNESENIAYAIYNNVVLLVIAIPLATLLKEIPGGRLVVEVVVVVLAFTFTTVVMFFKIWHRIILPQKLTGIPHHVGASKAATTASSSGGSSPASKKSKSSSDGNTSSAV